MEFIDPFIFCALPQTTIKPLQAEKVLPNVHLTLPETADLSGMLNHPGKERIVPS